MSVEASTVASRAVTAAETPAPKEEEPKPKFNCKSVDMPADLEEAATEIIVNTIVSYSLESEIATKIKKSMDADFGEFWHCIVGSSFGSFVSHSSGKFIYGEIQHEGPVRSILLFKTD